MMTLEEFDALLYPNGKPKPVFSNMVGIDHLIPSCHAYNKELENASKIAAMDKGFDPAILPYEKTIEYQICYFSIYLLRTKSFLEQLSFLYENSSKAQSWMCTDLCNKYLKKKRDFNPFQPYFLKFIQLEGTYQRRFGYVLGLKFAKEEESCNLFLNNIVSDSRYYVYMAEAWLLAELGIYHFPKVEDFLLHSSTLEELKRKAISKMMDSYRIDEEKKQRLREIRKEIF